MAHVDDWGRNPEVRKMRRIFQEMESGQERLLESVGISPFDTRLRTWRDKARVLFERLWPVAAATHGNMNEGRMGLLYVHCLGRVMSDDGISVSETLLPEDREIEGLLKGGLS